MRYGKEAEKLGLILSKKGIKRGSHLISFLLERLSNNKGILITESELIDQKIIKNSNFKTFDEFKHFMVLNKYLVVEREQEEPLAAKFMPGKLLKRYIPEKIKLEDEIAADQQPTQTPLNSEEKMSENRDFILEFLSKEMEKQNLEIDSLYEILEKIDRDHKDKINILAKKMNDQDYNLVVIIMEIKTMLNVLFNELGINPNDLLNKNR